MSGGTVAGVEGTSGAVILIAVLGGYLLGSIPFGVIATRLGGAGDLRRVGSGNIGATNVLRTGRRDLALLTLIGDGAKGAAAFLLASHFLGDNCGEIAAGAAFLGHLFPIWLRFRGGKGLATAAGILFAAMPVVGSAAAVGWIATFALTRISSAAALTAAAAAPILCLIFHQTANGREWLVIAMSALIFLRHHANIRRLIEGEEPQIGARRGRGG